MKYLLTFILSLTLCVAVQSQSLDTLEVSFKAKLLTATRFGLADSTTILKDIQNQQVTFLKSPSGNIVLVKVKFDQKYFKGTDKMFTDLLGDCFYYLAFNKSTSKFYRLGGFDTLDLVEFFNDLSAGDSQIFDIDYSSESEVDFYCLLKYSQLSGVKKVKKGFNCFKSCNEEISEYLIIPKKK